MEGQTDDGDQEEDGQMKWKNCVTMIYTHTQHKGDRQDGTASGW